jgi:hypothetical protein
MPIRRIFADISELLTGAETLVLDADATAGDGTITVKSIIGAAVNNILLFRYPGNELAEIVATHAVTAPSGNTVTLAANLVESHPAGTVVYIIRYNQVRFYWYATEVDAETTAPTALAAAQAIDPTMVRNFYDDTVETTGFYYYRFIDSINTVNSLYSDPIPFGAKDVRFAEDEVGYVLEFVRRKLGHEWDGRFSKQTAMDEINACLRYMQGKLKRFSRYLVQDYVLGQTARGVLEIDLPDNIYDNKTNKSILQIRIGSATAPLIPLDEKEFDTLLQEAIHTQVRTQPAIGAVTLEVDNSYDFDDDGTLHIYSSNTLDEITYTGITRSATAGVFTGIPATGAGSIAATHAVDSNVWQNEIEGEPRYFNVKNGKIRIYPLCDSTWQNKNVVADYNQEVTKVDSESDTIDAPRYDAVKHWLLWQGKAYWRNNGKADIKDEDFLMFGDILKSAIRTEVSGQKYKMAPKLNSVNYRAGKRESYEDI